MKGFTPGGGTAFGGIEDGLKWEGAGGRALNRETDTVDKGLNLGSSRGDGERAVI